MHELQEMAITANKAIFFSVFILFYFILLLEQFNV